MLDYSKTCVTYKKSTIADIPFILNAVIPLSFIFYELDITGIKILRGNTDGGDEQCAKNQELFQTLRV